MDAYTSPVHGGRSGSHTGHLERGGTPGSHSSVLAAAGARRVSLPVSRPGSRGATPERLLTLGTRSGSSLGDPEVKGGPRLDTALAFGRPVRIGAHSRSDRATRAASPTKEEQEVDADRVTQPSVADEWRAGFLSRLLLWWITPLVKATCRARPVQATVLGHVEASDQAEVLGSLLLDAVRGLPPQARGDTSAECALRCCRRRASTDASRGPQGCAWRVARACGLPALAPVLWTVALRRGQAAVTVSRLIAAVLMPIPVLGLAVLLEWAAGVPIDDGDSALTEVFATPTWQQAMSSVDAVVVVVAVAVVGAVQTVMMQQHRSLAAKQGMIAGTAVAAAAVLHTSRLPGRHGRVAAGTGSVTVQRLQESLAVTRVATACVTALGALPFEAALVLAMLVAYLSWSGLVPVGAALLSFPCHVYASQRLLRDRSARRTAAVVPISAQAARTPSGTRCGCAWSAVQYLGAVVMVAAGVVPYIDSVREPATASTMFTLVALCYLLHSRVCDAAAAFVVVREATRLWRPLTEFLQEEQLTGVLMRVPMRATAVAINKGQFSWPVTGRSLGQAEHAGGMGSNTTPIVLQLDGVQDIADNGAPADFCLVNITTKIELGSVVAVAGVHGSGKTTLLAAMLGELEVGAGTAAINCESLRDVGYCPQEPWVWDGSLVSNIVGDHPVDADRAAVVIVACCLTRNVEEWPQKEHTMLGPRSTTRVDACCAARIALARVLYSDAPLLLLDAVFEQVTPGLRATVLDNTLRLVRGRTVLITVTPAEAPTLAVSLLQRASSVVVMSKGRLVEQGTWGQLMPEFDDARTGGVLHALLTALCATQHGAARAAQGAVAAVDALSLRVLMDAPPPSHPPDSVAAAEGDAAAATAARISTRPAVGAELSWPYLVSATATADASAERFRSLVPASRAACSGCTRLAWLVVLLLASVAVGCVVLRDMQLHDHARLQLQEPPPSGDTLTTTLLLWSGAAAVAVVAAGCLVPARAQHHAPLLAASSSRRLQQWTELPHVVLALAGLVACLVVGIQLAPLSVALFAPCVVIVAIHAVVAARSIATLSVVADAAHARGLVLWRAMVEGSAVLRASGSLDDAVVPRACTAIEQHSVALWKRELVVGWVTLRVELLGHACVLGTGLLLVLHDARNGAQRSPEVAASTGLVLLYALGMPWLFATLCRHTARAAAAAM